MKKIIFLIFIAAFCICGCGTATKDNDKPVKEIILWHGWGGKQKERLDRFVAEFNKQSKDFKVRATFSAENLNTNQRFFTAVASNRPPDVTFVDGLWVAAWANQGALMPLDQFIERDGINKNDYFEPCWNQNIYGGKTWAMPYSVDANFAFSWNKKMFRKAGLDPERPPRTIEELDRYNKILTKTKNGKIVSMGIVPWFPVGGAYSLYSWGWTFGGEFYDKKNKRITADNPKVLAALEWMKEYAEEYGITKINSFSSGFGSGEQSPFILGIVAMQFAQISNIEEYKEYAPNLDYGLSYLPYPEGGEKYSSWVGGICLAIPAGSKHPKEAWEFIKWCTNTGTGTTKMGSIQGMFPGYRKSPYLKNIEKGSHYEYLLNLLKHCKHQRPVIPTQDFYTGSLNRAFEYALYGTKTPKQALEDATKESQAELDLQLLEK